METTKKERSTEFPRHSPSCRDSDIMPEAPDLPMNCAEFIVMSDIWPLEVADFGCIRASKTFRNIIFHYTHS
ncbi:MULTISPECIES: hypothetical protein [Rhizobium]|uniref:hypothetical protein n=1 Tax=Rhizobium TaxID=379 RepID=UPI0011124C40|nr:hypothetical protein [Rhizobium miluonense]